MVLMPRTFMRVRSIGSRVQGSHSCSKQRRSIGLVPLAAARALSSAGLLTEAGSVGGAGP